MAVRPFRSFQAVAGPKPDRFQTEVTAALLAAMGAALLAARDPEPGAATAARLLAAGAACGVAVVDWRHRKAIRPLFRAEAALEVAFAVAAVVREREADGGRRMTIRGGPYSGEREEGHAAGCAPGSTASGPPALPAGPRTSDRPERRADDRGPARVSLARLSYREPAPELAAAVDRFLAVRDLMPTSRRSYRQVLTAVIAAAGPTRPVGGPRRRRPGRRADRKLRPRSGSGPASPVPAGLAT